MARVHNNGNHGLFLHEQLAHFHTANTQNKVSNIASDEDVIENNYMFLMQCSGKVEKKIETNVSWLVKIMGHSGNRRDIFFLQKIKTF